MILRKPYAILIKNFRLIHAAIAVSMIYLLYRTYLIYDYLSKFLLSEMLSVKRGIADELITKVNYVLPIIIALLLAAIIVLMIRKKKPILFYIINIVIYSVLIFCYSYSYNFFTEAENIIPTNQATKAASDIMFMIMLVQIISTIFSLIRATGFDIKKFDFGKDLHELNITEEDDEEFEVRINIEGNVVKRTVNKGIRYAKYIYAENKLLIIGGSLLVVLAIGLIIYLNLDFNKIQYKQSDMFSSGAETISITNSFSTKENYRGENITDNRLVVLEVYIKTSKKGTKLNTARTELIINNISFYPVDIKYSDYLMDLGVTYYHEELEHEFKKYILTYEIPNKFKTKNAVFRYIDDITFEKNKLKPNYITVGLDIFDLDSMSGSIESLDSNSIKLNEKTLLNTELSINSIDIDEMFINRYTFCITKAECYDSIEYIKPRLNTNYDKALIRIDSNFIKDKDLNIPSLLNLVNLFNMYGHIEYEKDGKGYKYSNKFVSINPSKTKDNNIYYLEVNKTVMESDKASIILLVRNRQYEIKLK